MSGHSKWSTIKHKKAAKDQKRGELFSKLSKDIAIAVREGGSSDPEQNSRLRLLLQKARSANMPSQNINKAVARGMGKGTSKRLEEVVYEGYGPGGIAVITVARVENRNRTGAEVKFLYEQAGGSLGAPGSAVFLFERGNDDYTPKVKLSIADSATEEKLNKLISKLASREDVKAVYYNADISHE